MFGLIPLIAAVATLNVTYVDTGKTFTLPPQTTIVVTLSSCGSCGYHWELKPLDRSVIRRVSHRYVAPRGRGIGGAGKEIWSFRTVGAGRSPLQLAYVPPGRHTKPARTCGLKINVS